MCCCQMSGWLCWRSRWRHTGLQCICSCRESLIARLVYSALISGRLVSTIRFLAVQDTGLSATTGIQENGSKSYNELDTAKAKSKTTEDWEVTYTAAQPSQQACNARHACYTHL